MNLTKWKLKIYTPIPWINFMNRNPIKLEIGKIYKEGKGFIRITEINTDTDYMTKKVSKVYAYVVIKEPVTTDDFWNNIFWENSQFHKNLKELKSSDKICLL